VRPRRHSADSRPGFLSALLSCLVLITAALRAQTISRSRDQAIFYTLDDSAGLVSFLGHMRHITTLAPQDFSLDYWGLLRGGISPQLLEAARDNHVRVMPLVINRGFHAWQATRLLRSPAARDRAIAALLAAARRLRLSGWQLDFEGMPSADRALFTRFAAQAARALHRHGLVLSVAVAARTSDRPTPIYRRFSGVYDYSALARRCDFLSLMAYPESGRHHPGPLASYPWVAQVLSFVLRRVPPDKISLGVPDYQTDWGYHRIRITFWHRIGRRLYRHFRWIWRLIGFTGQAHVHPGRLHWDPALRSSYRAYGHGLRRHIIWVETPRSIEAKLDLVSVYHLRGHSIWRLGLEDPRLWARLPVVAPPLRLEQSASVAAAQLSRDR
jgi:spore germination protein YaaH